MFVMHRFVLLACGLPILLSQVGCTLMDHRTTEFAPCAPGEILVERGLERPVIDGIGWVVGIPGKVILWNSRVDNHNVSPRTEEQVRAYLASNGLYDTKVRINQYAPLDEWRRLRQNEHVAPGWKYTFGALETLGYTVFPGRIFGGDDYNPYTNSVHVYSDVPSLAVLNAAYANDVNTRAYPGTYVFTQGITGLNMIHETNTTQETLDYTELHGTPADLREAYNVLSPRYGLVLGSTISQFVAFNPASGGFQLVGLLGGHAIGRHHASQIPDVETPAPSYSQSAVPDVTMVAPVSYETAAVETAVD